MKKMPKKFWKTNFHPITGWVPEKGVVMEKIKIKKQKKLSWV